MARPERYTVQQVIDAIRRGYTPTGAASVLGCDPDTVRNYARRYPTVKQALMGERKAIVDLAEIGLRGAVLAKEPWAIAFALRTLGKDEGYTERLQLDVKHILETIRDKDGLDPDEVMGEAQRILKEAASGR